MHVDEVELRVIRLPYRSVFKTSFAAETEKLARDRHGPLRRRRGLRRRGDGPVAGVPRGVASPARCTCCARRWCPSLLAQRLRRPA